MGPSGPQEAAPQGEEASERLPPRLSFSRQLRIRNHRDFQKVLYGGAKVVAASVALHYRPTGRPVTRLGISVGRGVGRAVVRNRVKRFVRETFRLNRPRITAGYDLVFVARKEIAGKPLREVEQIVLGLLERAGLLRGGGLPPGVDRPPSRAV